MTGISEMFDSVNALVLGDIEGISEQMGFSVGTEHKIVPNDLVFSKVSCR